VSIRFWCHPHPVYNVSGEDDTELVRSWKLEVGSWKLEVGSWKLEVGSWKLGVGVRIGRGGRVG
jgi:hypothetical protein